jgi:hypothetical protein
MSEFDNNAMTGWAILGVLIPLAAASFSTVAWHDLNLPKRMQKWAIGTSIALGLTGWIWGPWAGFGIWSIYQKSVAGINYYQRPDEVIPPNRQVIDLNKPEHK